MVEWEQENQSPNLSNQTEMNPPQTLSHIGKLLSRTSRLTKYSILKSLQQASRALSKLDQSTALKSVISSLSDSLVKQALLHHKDKEVRLLVTVCLTEIIRVLAPEPPFNDDTLRDIFDLILCVFVELVDITSPYFPMRVQIVETIAELKFCCQMLDIGCDDLILQMFNICFSVVRIQHPQSLLNAIVSILSLILKEEVSRPLLEVVFQNLLIEGKGASQESSHLSVCVIKNCTKELEPHVRAFITSCISNKDAVESELKEFYHEIIFKIFLCAPEMLLAVIPSLTQELLTDQVDIRIKALNLIGKLLAMPGCHVAQEYPHFFVEFVRRFSDKSVDVRLCALKCAKACFLANPCDAESLELLSAFEGRLLDFDDRVRMQAVVISCDLAIFILQYVSANPISRVSKQICDEKISIRKNAMQRLQEYILDALIVQVCNRLRDKKISVRKNAFRKLLEVYQSYCTMCSEGHMRISDRFEQIPCRILVLCFDKDCKEFRPQSLEIVLADDLFPVSLSVAERTRHWIYLFSCFTPAHVKALSSILFQKQRLQTEMQSFLALVKKKKYMLQENGAQVEDRVKASFMKMSMSFSDPCRAQECFLKLGGLKDNNIFDILRQLLDEVTFVHTQIVKDKLMSVVECQHPQFEFLCSLFAKCSCNIFSSEHVSYILDNIFGSRFENRHLEMHAVNFLVTILSISPSLSSGCEKQLQDLLLEEYPYNDKLIHMLAKVGAHISIRLRDIYPCLESVCLDGTRTLSKHSVCTIAVMSCTSDQFVFSGLLKKLVHYLHAGKNIPTVLQSLGCIAQHSTVAFQMCDQEIKHYINNNVFQVIDGKQSYDITSFDECSDCGSSCKLKIYALKTLVRSFLPHHGAHVRCEITNLLDILSNMLENGEAFEGTVSSETDKSYIRLAAAISVLRLSRRWDFHINPQIFYSTILMAKHTSSLVRRLFIDKLHKLLRAHSLPNRYACAFALFVSDSLKDLREDSLKYMEEFIRERSRNAQINKTSLEQSGSISYHPAYIVVYLIHVLAYDTEFPSETCTDEEIYVCFCRPLFFALQALVNVSSVDTDLGKDVFSHLHAIFRAIIKAEDGIDALNTPKLHVLSDIGISILYILNKNSHIPSSHTSGKILLPSSFYKSFPKTCQASYALEESFIARVVNLLKLQAITPSASLAMCCQKNSLQLDGAKQSATNFALGSQTDFSRNDKTAEGKDVFKCGTKNPKSSRLEANTRAKQKRVFSTVIPRAFEMNSQILSRKLDVLSSGLPKENGVTLGSNINTEGVSKDRCNSNGIIQKREPLARRAKSFSSDENRDPKKHSSLTKQRLSDVVEDDTSQLQETLPTMGKENLFITVIPSHGKRKKVLSVLNGNNDNIARRTRSRKM